MNKQQIARKINKLVELRTQAAHLQDRAEMLTLQLKKYGGGKSKRWLAVLVKMPKRIMIIRAHKQLRIFPRTPPR
jgi:hypothetical protein